MNEPTEHPSGLQDFAPCAACARVLVLANSRFQDTIKLRSTNAESSRAVRARDKAAECFDACCRRTAEAAPCPVPPWFTCAVCAAELTKAVAARRAARAKGVQLLYGKLYRPEYERILQDVTAIESAALAQATLAAEECARGSCRNPQTAGPWEPTPRHAKGAK